MRDINFQCPFSDSLELRPLTTAPTSTATVSSPSSTSTPGSVATTKVPPPTQAKPRQPQMMVMPGAIPTPFAGANPAHFTSNYDLFCYKYFKVFLCLWYHAIRGSKG